MKGRAMIERRRLTIVAAALAAVVLLAGVAAAALLPSTGGQPQTAQSSPEAKEKPSAEKVQRILEGLKNAGISTTTAEFSALAGKGWGEIRRELGIAIGPGIGWLMGRGHGQKPAKVDEGD